MKKVCKWCGDPCGVLIQRQGRQVTFSDPATAIGRRTPRPVPTVLGRAKTRPLAPVMMALIGEGPNPGIGVFWV